jgi:hypothetical protein
VIETLADLFLMRGVPAHIRSDQGVRLQMLCDSREAFVNGGSGSVAV